jgi:hypothetical protein
MTIPEESTWEISGDARRPTLADVGGAELLNEENYEPATDGTEPTAEMLNQGQYQAHAVGRVVPSCLLTIDFVAGVPTIITVQAANPNLDASDFTVTDTATGNTLVAWTTGTLPAMGVDPMLSLGADGVKYTGNCVAVSATSFRVKTYSDGVLTNIRFTVAIY